LQSVFDLIPFIFYAFLF